MNTRRWGFVILFAAMAAALAAFRLRFDPVAVAGAITLLGFAVVCVLVVLNARRRLASSRAAMMRDAGMCPACGYFIRVPTDCCPECGKPVARD